jgi:hypothetical protein
MLNLSFSQFLKRRRVLCSEAGYSFTSSSPPFMSSLKFTELCDKNADIVFLMTATPFYHQARHLEKF